MTNFSEAFNLTCDIRNKTHIGILSTLCVNGSFREDVCVPEDEKRQWRMALGAWAIVIVLIGIFGNTFTLLAVPYAARRQRYSISNH